MNLLKKITRQEKVTLKVPQIAQEKRAIALRVVASTFLWFLIIGCFILTLYTSGLTARAVRYMNGNALTPAAAETRRLAMDTAKDFAVEWATFDGKDIDDYQKRLAMYIKDGLPAPPDGLQRCVSATVKSIEKVDSEKDLFRVKVNLHVNKVVAVPETQLVGKLSRARIAQTVNDQGNITRYAWQDEIICTEISVIASKKGAYVIGLPVPVPGEQTPGVPLEDMLSAGQASSEFQTFARQAMTMYFEGKDISNYVSPEANIKPLGGYTVTDVALKGFSKRDDTAKAVLKVTVSSKGIGKQEHVIVITAAKKDRWMLTRLGSW